MSDNNIVETARQLAADIDLIFGRCVIVDHLIKLAAEIERLREEVKALRSAQGDANGCEPAGCPIPGACACVRHDNELRDKPDF